MPAAEARSPADADPILRIGVAGVGSLGQHHARIVADMVGVESAGVFDMVASRAHEVTGKLGVVAHGSLDALLDHTDALVVAVPTTHHEEISIRALERGLAVLIEKPMAPDLAAADRILEAARRSGAIVQVGHVERFNSAVLAAEQYLDQPLFIESHRMAPFSTRSTDVAVVLDLMIHDVDLVQSLMGTPIQEIAASGVPVLSSSIDIASARLTFEGGAVANLTASRVSLERVRKVRIFQRSGYLSLDLAAGKGEFLRLKGELPALSGQEEEQPPSFPGGLAGLASLVDRIPIEGDGVEPLRSELDNFRKAALGLVPPAVTGEEGRAALAVTLSIEERIKTHVSDSHPA